MTAGQLLPKINTKDDRRMLYCVTCFNNLTPFHCLWVMRKGIAITKDKTDAVKVRLQFISFMWI